MRKNILYIAMACFALGFTACSDDPNDAVTKHVYGPDEAPYLRADANATISNSLEFKIGHLAVQTINLKNYAEQIQTKLKMTVDDVFVGLENGDIVFYNINTSRGAWDKTAPTKGSTGWYYNSAGGVTTESNAQVAVELDKANKQIVVSVPETVEDGMNGTVNVGFAVDNKKDYDMYVRFSISYKVSDPSSNIVTINVPNTDYTPYVVDLNDYEDNIKDAFGMTLKEFCEAIQSTDGDMVLYMLDKDGNWITDQAYTASGMGYWCDADGNIMKWADKPNYFVESHGDEGAIYIGAYPGQEAGTEFRVRFVYTLKSDNSKFIQFVFKAVLID